MTICGFTLIEICVVLFLAIMLISVASAESFSGQMARRRLQEASDRLDELADRAREHSITEGRPYLLIWEKERVHHALLPGGQPPRPCATKPDPVSALTPTGSNEHYTLLRSASLTEHPAAEWTFWPTGNCEGVTVGYQSNYGVSGKPPYSPLTRAGGAFTKFVAR